MGFRPWAGGAMRPPGRHSCQTGLVLALLALVALPAAAAGSAKPRFTSLPRQQHAADRVLVKPHGAKALSAGATAAQPVAQVTKLKAGESVDAAIKRLSALEEVEYAVPDMYLYSQAVPNDPDYGRQWGLARVGGPAAWDISTGSLAQGVAVAQGAGDGSVTVCVVDSGVDPTHPDLQPNLHPDIGYNAWDPAQPPSDTSGHGTHIAGIIAAASNNGQLGSGVAWGGAVKVLSCKFIGPEGYGLTSKAIACLQYCVAKGARVISASWTGGTADNPPLKEAIARAGEAGALVVVAAGNQGLDLRQSPAYPALYSRDMPFVLTVGAIDERDTMPTFSNWDPTSVQLCAPGVNILSTVPALLKPGLVEAWSGTSMATPFVSGAAALVLAASGGALSARDLRDVLTSSAAPVPALADKVASGGVLRVDAALLLALARLGVPRPSASPSPSPAPAKYRTVTTVTWVACKRGSSKACIKRCTTTKVKVKGANGLTKTVSKSTCAYKRKVVVTKRVKVSGARRLLALV